MKVTASIIAVFVGVLVTISSADPLYEEDLQPYQYQQQQYEPYEAYHQYQEYGQVRERRSPQQTPPTPPPPPPGRGSVSMTGGHTSGQGGFARGEYNHKLWQGGNGARVDANTYYQRNWGTPGPRQDYGGGVRLTVPFGG